MVRVRQGLNSTKSNKQELIDARNDVDDMAPPEGEAGPGMNVDPALARPTKGVLSGKQGSQVVGGVRRGTAKARPNRRR